MWKVLIADDEPKIRRGLRSLLARCGDDLQVVGEAEDGEMAFSMAIEFEPDILLVDVRMPFRNGLDLIGDLNSALPGRIVIIVSGHDEFEYAQAAVKLHVFDYVLKPVDAKSFIAVVEKAKVELETRLETGKYVTWAREQLERSLPVLRERFLKDWATGSLSRTEVAEDLAFLRIELGAPATLIGTRFAERSASGISGTERSRRLALVAMRTIMQDVLPAGSYVFEDDTETVLAITAGIGNDALTELVERLESRASEQVYQVPSIATRPVPELVAGLCDSYEEIRSELADGGNCEAFVVLARNFVDKHYWNPDLSLEDAADELQISPGYLSRLMKRETGFSFVEYLNRIRIKKATVLMSDPSAKAFEVAERVGYRSQHYFSRAFKKVTGTSPTDHRKGGAS
jgi:two-component system, response regulator YesN